MKSDGERVTGNFNTDSQELSRSLKSRHIQMIAIGGAIGTGLFLGSGTAIHEAGPSIILSYFITGIFCFFLMRAIGELLLSNTALHSFIDFVGVYLGNGLKFITGWTYWLCWISIAMADLTASGIYMRFWFPWLPQWITPLVIILLLLLVNLVNVKMFGEMESWFSLIKVVAIIFLIVVGLYLIAIGFQAGNAPRASFTNLISHGGFFPTGVHGFLQSFPMVVFAFVGIEMVGVTAGETENPQVNLPKAINNLPVRIGLFYIGSMIIIMSVYPWNMISESQSPFVQVFGDVGIQSAAAIINFVVLTAALSACNSAIFTTSRTLRSLSSSADAPKIFHHLSKHHVPNVSLLFSSLILLIVVALNYFVPDQIFALISGVATINFLFVWSILILAHLAFKKNYKYESTFKAPMYPYADYATLLFFFAIAVILLITPGTRVALIISTFWFIGMYVAYLLIKRHRMIGDGHHG